MLVKLRSLLDEYLSFSLGARLAIGGLVGAIGSSTVIGFLAEFGAVNYALAYGARLPTEGVPYLRYAVTGISFMFFLITAGVLLFLNWLLKASLSHFTTSSTLGPWKSYAEMPLAQYAFRGVLPATAAATGLLQMFYALAPINTVSQWGLISLSFALIVLFMILGRKPTWTKWVVLAAFLGCIGSFLVASFTPSLYGRALLFTRQGGGLPIKLKINCKDTEPCEAEMPGHLFLKTIDYYFFRDPQTQQIREVPSRSVEGVSYIGEERWGTQ